MQQVQRGFAVVTGASQGLGECIALELAKRGFGIIGMARNRDGLDRVAEACGKRNGGRTRVIVADLSDEAATHRAAEAVLALGLPLEALVNNAGYAVWGRFPDQPLDAHRNMLQVNMLAPVILTHHLLPALRQLGFVVATEPQGAFYIYADVSALAEDSEQLARRLIEEAGVAATPGLDFGHHHPRRHLRIAYTTRQDRLLEAAERIAAVLRP